MTSRLLMTTALIVALAAPALAQDTKPAPAPQAKPPLALDVPANPCAPHAMTPHPESEDNQNRTAEKRIGSGDKILGIQEYDVSRASELIGKAAFNRDNERLGTVDDVLIDEAGNVSGVVLSIGGFLGIGDKLVGLDWHTAVRQVNEELVVVDVTAAELEAAPSFKTQEAIDAERQAMRMQQEQERMKQRPKDSAAPDQSTQ